MSHRITKNLALACAMSALSLFLVRGSAFATESLEIHIMNFASPSDAIVLDFTDNTGAHHFCMVDVDEDTDYPENPRPGVNTTFGFEDEVIAYLRKIGADEDNIEFIVGTHAHSDHIGSLDDVIYALDLSKTPRSTCKNTKTSTSTTPTPSGTTSMFGIRR